jgi:hypothetical protein
MSITFHCCDKIPERNSLKGVKIYFGPQFKRFQSRLGWLHYFGPEAMLNEHHGRECTMQQSVSPHGSWEAEREKERERERE